MSAAPGRVILEVAVSSLGEARFAASAGADRLEVCANLDCGGLTPSLGTFRAIREAVRLPLYVMLRPRPGGFRYSPAELRVMRLDADLILDAGASGVVFGVLNADGEIDAAACAEVIDRARGRAVFHRAFDFVRDQRSDLADLIELGFERVQTSGRALTALDGAEQIARLVEAAAGGIAILPAGGISPENVAEVVRRTGCRQVHGSFRGPAWDASLSGNPLLAGAMGDGVAGRYRATDPGLVAATRVELDRFVARATD